MDKEEVLKKIKAGDIWLEDVDKKLQADKEVVLAAVKTSVYALQYAGKKLKADKEVVLAAVKQDGLALQYADKKLQADKEVVLAAVKQNEDALNYLTKSCINDLKLNRIKIRVEGQGKQYYFQEISQETYNFYKDEGVLLCNAVSGNPDGDDIVGDLPTYYDEIDPLAGFQIDNSSLEITNYGGESQTIELSDANIKKLGINCKTKFVNMQDIINSKEGYVFLAYEEEVSGSNDSLPMLIENEFDLKKLRLTITNFAIEPDNSTLLITGFGYGNEKTDGLVPELIEGTEFELFRVLKKDKITKKRKAKKKDDDMNDKEAMLAAVKQDGLVLVDADKKLQADKDVVLAAVKESGSALEYADKKLQADKDVVLIAVKQDGFALEYADKNLKADKEVVLAALKQNGWALEYADKKFKTDKEVVLIAVKQEGSALDDADKKLQADKEVVLAAVKESGSALKYADKKLQADKEVVLAAVKQDKEAVKYAANSIITDLKK